MEGVDCNNKLALLYYKKGNKYEAHSVYAVIQAAEDHQIEMVSLHFGGRYREKGTFRKLPLMYDLKKYNAIGM